MRLGIIADAHLGPPGTGVWAFHTGYETADITSVYRIALRRCVREGVDAVVLLGDLSASGDGESIEAGCGWPPVRVKGMGGIRQP